MSTKSNLKIPQRFLLSSRQHTQLKHLHNRYTVTDADADADADTLVPSAQLR